ncbi:MAG: hypothetical protein U0176_26260 [Bacteroidia bacterium]
MAVAAVQLGILALGTPLYDIDTNSFVRGGLSWDIYHNPLLNIYIAACTKVWPNVWFMVGLQTVFFAATASFLAHVMFGGKRIVWLGLGVAAMEPLTMFYNHSLLAESFFTSLAMASVALLVLWMRDGGKWLALGFGLAMGLCFMSKLSAMIHVPLFGLMLLRFGRPFWDRVRGLGMALLPFVACYAFVFIGQRLINEGDIYTVEGRVRWDFSSALYDSTEAYDPAFARFVHPHLYRDGKLVAHRELRRELSYLGYKDCVADYEARGFAANRGINACDSIFGRVAAQVMQRHFWEAERQFVADNFRFVHELSYIDYRFTPDLYYYHPESEYHYIDSLMQTTYGYSLAGREQQIPRIWRSLPFGNAYMTAVWWLWWLVLVTGLVLWLRDRSRWDVLVMGVITGIPQIFHLVYISYRPRFLAPYIVLMLLLLLVEIVLLQKSKGRPAGTAL